MTRAANAIVTHEGYSASVPFLSVASGHTGVPRPRTGPELSDLAQFAVAVLAVWLLRRALRRRFKHKD